MAPAQPQLKTEQPIAPPQQDLHVYSHVCLRVTMVRHIVRKQGLTRFTRVEDEDLTEYGILQAKALAHRFGKQKFDHIITSDLKRCVQTTHEIEKKQKDAKVSIDVRLREQHLADLAGKTKPAMLKHLKENDKNRDEYLKSKGGETSQVFKARVYDFYEDLILNHLVEPHNKFLDKLSDQEAERERQQKIKQGVAPTPLPTPADPAFPNEAKSPSSNAMQSQQPAPLTKSHSLPAPTTPPPLLVTSKTNTTLTITTTPSPRSPSFLIPHPLLTPTSPTTTPLHVQQQHHHRRRRRPAKFLPKTFSNYPRRPSPHPLHPPPKRPLLPNDTPHPVPPHNLPQTNRHLRIRDPQVFLGEWGVGVGWRDWVVNCVSHLARVRELCGDGVERDKARLEKGKGVWGRPGVVEDGGGKRGLPGLPEKVGNHGEYVADSSSQWYQTPQVSPESRNLPVGESPVVPKRSLGW
ncbi:hypothetical protein BCR33DRAFT_370477 [Rhizoclosmatium globosum]|uniref:Uncharacterized protein n=1 Tax=Rhizoclosmatium globosum TaxID=329046 RepID=A0A1Y2BZF3_9FUNG|nr:hypothetical protein BCR33DRAFT_370477 [Rhizoclosmatium globosum]|eukprot:ORY40139.1 hypothetical protein BCR33DRAFT_370477 [Rhizoclosmatium globosum]